MTEAAPLASEQITQEDHALAEFIVSQTRGYGVKLPQDQDTRVQAAARHRIAALSASPAPVGWKLVPIEPTPEMIVAGIYALNDTDVDGLSMWSAMLAASPAPSGQGVSGEVETTADDRRALSLHHQRGGIPVDVADRMADQCHHRDPLLQHFAHRRVEGEPAPAPSCAPGEDLVREFVDALTNCGRNQTNCLSFNHDLLSNLIKEARDILDARPTPRKWAVNEREMAIAAAFGPVLREAFPKASPAQRMAVCDALASEIENRADWFRRSAWRAA